MLEELNSILELVTIFVSMFLLERYVFLEPGMEMKKQRFFYLISVCAVLFIYVFFGKDAATLVTLIAGGLNISLARKEHRLRGFFLIVPLPGIIDGFVIPILVIPVNLMSVSQTGQLVYGFIIYGLLIFLLFLFYWKGKNWRLWFQTEMQSRHLHTWEKFLLYMVGILMLFFSNVLFAMLGSNSAGKLRSVEERLVVNQLILNICILGITAFILTITIIVLIMQGSKRSYYHEKVSDMQLNMIVVMAEIIENRDENTGGHVKRTAKYVEVIAKTLKKQGVFPDILTERYLSDMVAAAPLHDIGKIHVSDVILNKPGKLTEEEFQIMKSHAAAGRDLLLHAKKHLGAFAYLDMAVDMAAYHHEWWDGRGYPDGIKGEEIPLCARIMAVADVFDALVSKRCYKQAMPLEKAYGIIREESGTHFDPVVVDAFFASLEEIEAISRGDMVLSFDEM